jgi:hypothetical protein
MNHYRVETFLAFRHPLGYTRRVLSGYRSFLPRRARRAGRVSLFETRRGRDEIFERPPVTLPATVDEMFGAAPGACLPSPRSHPRVAPPRKTSESAARGSFRGGALRSASREVFRACARLPYSPRARVLVGTAARRSFRVDSFRRFPARRGARQRLPRLDDGKPTRPRISVTPQTASPDSPRPPRVSSPHHTNESSHRATSPTKSRARARGLTEESTGFQCLKS